MDEKQEALVTASDIRTLAKTMRPIFKFRSASSSAASGSNPGTLSSLLGVLACHATGFKASVVYFIATTARENKTSGDLHNAKIAGSPPVSQRWGSKWVLRDLVLFYSAAAPKCIL